MYSFPAQCEDTIPFILSVLFTEYKYSDSREKN